jgi:formylglycine-generating enzyme required for sulfatase activity
MEFKTDESELNHLLSELENIETSHARRAEIGRQLALSGNTPRGAGVTSTGVPDIEWCYVEAAPGDEIKLGSFPTKKFPIKPFYIAKYMITNLQFQAFLDDPDDFNDRSWWEGLEKGKLESPESSETDSHPRGKVSWYQAVAFCRWLNENLSSGSLPDHGRANRKNWRVRLPMESEWQWAAQGGTETRKYPWGEWDDLPRANTGVAFREASTVVGVYPHGKAKCGALDMSGNLFEWCVDVYRFLWMIPWRVRRGGAFDSYPNDVRCVSRDSCAPSMGFMTNGLRVVYAPDHT